MGERSGRGASVEGFTLGRRRCKEHLFGVKRLTPSRSQLLPSVWCPLRSGLYVVFPQASDRVTWQQFLK